jgi:ESCRT-II complex subunit VPS22
MCATVGVDPLASASGAWAASLGFGDFYARLAVQVAEACLAHRPLDGGLTSVDTLLGYLARRRGPRADPVSVDDVRRAVAALGCLGPGFGLVKVGGARLVRSVPLELSTDTNAVLDLARERGWVTAAQLAQGLGWEAGRAGAALDALLTDGVALLDDPGKACPDGAKKGRTAAEEQRFWFPCLGVGLAELAVAVEDGGGGGG